MTTQKKSLSARLVALTDSALDHWKTMERPRLFVVGIGITFLALLIWALNAQIDRVVRADGRVIPAGRSQVIQHLEGGIVSAINTREGSLVRAGDVLISINDTGAGSRLGELQVKIAGTRAKIDRLTAETSEKGIRNGNSRAPLMPAMDAEVQLFYERQNKMRHEVDVQREQANQKLAELKELEARHGSLSQELEIARRQMQVMTGLAAKNAASQLEVLESQSKVQKLVTELKGIEGEIPKIRSILGEIEARIRVIKSQFRAEARNELTSALVELDRMLEEERAEKDRVARTDIRAPVDGIVNRLYVTTLGGVVRPGDVVMEITPAGGAVILEAKVAPSQRGELIVGQVARARITAHDFGVHGTLPGRLIEISADTVGEERSQERAAAGPQGYYRVQLEIDTRHYREKNLPILPGMTASADIVIGNRTVLQYLLSPLMRFNYHAFQESK
jgi:adhesin transport system membrane fusion protein